MSRGEQSFLDWSVLLATQLSSGSPIRVVLLLVGPGACRIRRKHSSLGGDLWPAELLRLLFVRSTDCLEDFSRQFEFDFRRTSQVRSALLIVPGEVCVR